MFSSFELGSIAYVLQKIFPYMGFSVKVNNFRKQQTLNVLTGIFFQLYVSTYIGV